MGRGKRKVIQTQLREIQSANDLNNRTKFPFSPARTLPGGDNVNGRPYSVACSPQCTGSKRRCTMGRSALRLANAGHCRAQKFCNATNRSQAPHVQASVHTQRMTRDKQWDGGPCRSRRLVPAPVSPDRGETCGHAIRRSWCLQNP
jgi:hypothetical protein